MSEIQNPEPRFNRFELVRDQLPRVAASIQRNENCSEQQANELARRYIEDDFRSAAQIGKRIIKSVLVAGGVVVAGAIAWEVFKFNAGQPVTVLQIAGATAAVAFGMLAAAGRKRDAIGSITATIKKYDALSKMTGPACSNETGDEQVFRIARRLSKFRYEGRYKL